jgi:capsular polysaccharide biosynthesis protein
VDLRMLLHAVRLHKAIFAIVVALGIAAGVAYTLVKPPLLASTQLVIVAGAKSVKTQAFYASSDPVLIMARKRLAERISLDTLRRDVRATSVAPEALTITAEAKTVREAQDIAHTVALSYKAYLAEPGNQIGNSQAVAQVVGGAAPPTGSTLRTKAIENGALGVLLGALLGVIISVARGRSDRKLRERDEIAGAIGVPVLASIPVVHPTDTAGWTRLLQEYEPAVVHAWNLRKALRYIGVSDVRYNGGPGVSVTVVSLSSDRRALAVGPQLAVFAASLGIPTVLSVGSQQDRHAVATLSAACTMAAAALIGAPGGLQFAVGDYKDAGQISGAALTVAVAVLDGKNPELPAMMRTNATVLAVTSGAVSAEQLARVAVSVTGDGRDVAGILVADPDSTDRTTGRLPQLAEMPRRRQSPPRRLPGHRSASQHRPDWQAGGATENR